MNCLKYLTCTGLLFSKASSNNFKKYSVSKIVLTFIVQINCSCKLEKLANSLPSASNLKKLCLITKIFFSHSTVQFSKQNAISKIDMICRRIPLWQSQTSLIFNRYVGSGFKRILCRKMKTRVKA